MVDRAGLENRSGCKPTVGSNPTLSAKFTYKNRIWALSRPFFVLVSKEFSFGGRPTETDKVLKISL